MNAIISLGDLIAQNPIITIPPYQRGYIWGKNRKDTSENSVEHILRNIRDSILTPSIPKKLFLQGLTVSEISDGISVIDGQQRMTFFFLLLTCLQYKNNMQIRYNVRRDNCVGGAGEFLRSIIGKSTDELHEMAKEDMNEKFQDLYFFKKTIRTILAENIPHERINDILTNIRFLYIVIPDRKASTVFTMMNGNKADMSEEEIIKAELLRLVSLSDDNSEDIRWEQNALRSRYAREWDKWLYWWNQNKVREFYRTEEHTMGWLLRTYFVRRAQGKKQFSFENFKETCLLGENPELSAKQTFYDLRHLQKSFEDIYNSAYETERKKRLHNIIGAILLLLPKGDRSKFIIDYFAHANSFDVCDYYKIIFLESGLSHSQIIKYLSNIDADEELKTKKIEMLRSLSSDNLYNEDNSYAFLQLLRRNIEEDTKLGRPFDFKIWKERSLEHIFPKSKVFDSVSNQIEAGEGNNEDMLDRSKFYGNGSEHCIGNLVLLYKNENSKFGAKTVEEKKSIYFQVDEEDKPFRSRHLLHSMSVFAKSSWGIREIQENKESILNEIKNYYGIEI
ncbi:DUF262 domain-containing protein [Parabacteroides distasonis]|nr:DUF262 domain-containing protein [Parabacteroides distasonis]